MHVRQYRKKMLEMLQDAKPGFGLRLPKAAGSPSNVSIEFTSLGSAVMRYSLSSGVNVTYRLDVNSDGSLSQKATISNESGRAADVPYELDLSLSVHRASYGQLTEGGPIPIPECENHLQILGNGGYFTITNRFLGACMQGCLDLNGQPVTLNGLQESTQSGAPLSSSMAGSVFLAAGATVELAARFELKPEAKDAESVARTAVAKESQGQDWNHPEKLETYIVRRNLDYILGNCSIPVSSGAVAVITDHVALPLGWNRDN